MDGFLPSVGTWTTGPSFPSNRLIVYALYRHTESIFYACIQQFVYRIEIGFILKPKHFKTLKKLNSMSKL